PAEWMAPDPEAVGTTPDDVVDAAIRYVEAGLSVIPIAADGSKSPDSRRLPGVWDSVQGRYRSNWSVFTVRRPRLDELAEWLNGATPFGLAVVGGLVSGGQERVGLEIIDFDSADLFEPWAEGVEQKVPGLVQRLVRVRSPRPGIHVYYRCAAFG